MIERELRIAIAALEEISRMNQFTWDDAPWTAQAALNEIKRERALTPDVCERSRCSQDPAGGKPAHSDRNSLPLVDPNASGAF